MSLTPREIKAIAAEHSTRFRISDADMEAMFDEEKDLFKKARSLDARSPLRYAFNRLLAMDIKCAGGKMKSLWGEPVTAEDIAAVPAEIEALKMERIVSLKKNAQDMTDPAADTAAFISTYKQVEIAKAMKMFEGLFKP